jgi:hypothetical protein
MSATLTHPTGDLSLGLWSPGVVRLACPNLPSPSRCFSNSNIPAPGGGWMETITFTATVSAPYYFHVDSIYSSAQARIRPPDAETPYTLDVSIKP